MKLNQAIEAFINLGTDDETSFSKLALNLFFYQFQHNPIYQYICQKHGIEVQNIKHWTEIPYLHTSAFKEAPLSCIKAQDYFETSGTTQTNKGRHYYKDLTLYELSLKTNFKMHLLPDLDQIPIIILFPSIQERPFSSLAHMFHIIQSTYGSDVLYVQNSSDFPKCVTKILQWIKKDEPLLMLGSTINFIHFFEKLQITKSLRLPDKSRLMDTGGTKGQDRSISKDQFRETAHQLLGLNPNYIINEYGMTEMFSQFYNGKIGENHSKIFKNPPWVRTQVISTDGVHETEIGKVGLLRHFDLANHQSIIAIQTEDLARRHSSGFELLGRPSTSELRGCSLTICEKTSDREKNEYTTENKYK